MTWIRSMKKMCSEMKEMISRHYTYTGSTVAKFVLDDFENQLKNFVKVFPKDYKKVLSEKKARVGSQFLNSSIIKLK